MDPRSSPGTIRTGLPAQFVVKYEGWPRVAGPRDMITTSIPIISTSRNCNRSGAVNQSEVAPTKYDGKNDNVRGPSREEAELIQGALNGLANRQDTAAERARRDCKVCTTKDGEIGEPSPLIKIDEAVGSDEPIQCESREVHVCGDCRPRPGSIQQSQIVGQPLVAKRIGIGDECIEILVLECESIVASHLKHARGRVATKGGEHSAAAFEVRASVDGDHVGSSKNRLSPRCATVTAAWRGIHSLHAALGAPLVHWHDGAPDVPAHHQLHVESSGHEREQHGNDHVLEHRAVADALTCRADRFGEPSINQAVS